MFKPVTHIVFVLDRSGSMSSMGVEPATGFNTFVEEQKKIKGKARLTLIQFDTEYEVNCERVKLKDAPKLVLHENYNPRGATALLDALGKAITTHEQEERVIIGVLTDGRENSSRAYKLADVSKLIERKQKDGWEFLYLSSDLNAFADAANLNIPTHNTFKVSPDAAGVRSAYTNMSANTTSYRSGS